MIDHAGTVSCNKGSHGGFIAQPFTASSFGQYTEGVGTVRAAGGDLGGGSETLLPIPYRKSKRACSTTDNETWVESEVSNTFNNFDLGDTRTTHAVVYENHPNDSRVTGPHDVAPTVVSRFGTGGGNVPFVADTPIAFQPGNLRRKGGADPSTEVFPTLTKDSGDQSPHVAQPVAFDSYNQTVSNTTQAVRSAASDVDHVGAVFIPAMAVRRLTPVECERLQGFPDNWSRIPWKGKPEEQCPDGPRYKACGNSMAVPVMRWIGERINLIEQNKTI